MSKYKVKICHFSEIEINEENAISKEQKGGWKICGPIIISQTKEHCTDKSIRIPFKKRDDSGNVRKGRNFFGEKV
jgi:hypothetical protein